MAISAMRVANKARVEKPSFNKNEFASQEQLAASKEPAPPLKLDVATGDSNSTENDAADDLDHKKPSTSSLLRRHRNGTLGDASPYTVPTQLADAARKVAESTNQTPEGDHSDVAAAMRARYAGANNDTNAPSQEKRPEGRLGNYGKSSTAEKRDSSYWMVDEAPSGYAPFATKSGYKVFRNIRDYGAVGDGKTDDTDAINRAVADGDRCGANCGSSTTTPAVVYFPSGTYLVSSPIIQYFDTQFLRDPHNVPTILAASSFVGLGVITSDVYVGDNEEWYLNTANFYRIIRNFKMDIRLPNPTAYVCAIHWQVAQATSLENIEFYMQYNSDIPENTQQGIYMENGSGGYLADLTFVGGNFGAYFGNQQFTTSNLIFVRSNTAVQVHWDWAWTMQDFVIESCNTGLMVIGGAGGSVQKPDDQGVGSLVLVDAIIANTKNGIVTTLKSDHATSFLLQNVGFFNVETAVQDRAGGQVLVAGGNQVVLDSWGFGLLSNAAGELSTFVNGDAIPAMNRPKEFLGKSYDSMKPNLFTRRRPKYYDEPRSNIMNVRTLGAKGDGSTDDTAVLNSVLEGAANTSSIVFIPHGVYIVTDTLRVPLGSRIIGQAWSQIMGKGKTFSDEMSPKAVVQVGRPGDRGIVEIQDLLFTVNGATEGAVIVEWNVQESTQGSAGLWDSHIRVGGAAGSNLQYRDCPKGSSSAMKDCKAASVMLHLKPNSTAYIENMWPWVADHDLDRIDLGQLDIYTGRGVLVESRLAYFWGTASEHAVLYQYQLSNAANILMGMIQTESPYFQPTPAAPYPFKAGIFPNDPTFEDCAGQSDKCAVSWAARIVDSSSVYILGAGLYSWFHNYDQACVETNDCQLRGVEVEESYDVWIYNLCTKAIVEMVSPKNSAPTLAKDNVNGFLSSILGWLQGSQDVSGRRNFTGFAVYEPDFVKRLGVSDTCETALKEHVYCHEQVQDFRSLDFRGSLNNVTLTDLVCADGCRKSLESWTANVKTACADVIIADGVAYAPGMIMLSGMNETCLRDETTGDYCNDVIDGFTEVDSINGMPIQELCSYCNVQRLAVMQETKYSTFDAHFKSELDYVNSHCQLSKNTTVPDRICPDTPGDDSCHMGEWYTTEAKITCDDISLPRNISSASLYLANQNTLATCGTKDPIPSGTKLCIPPSCSRVYQVEGNSTCSDIEIRIIPFPDIRVGDVRKYNRWVNVDCTNMDAVRASYGSTICLGPLFGDAEIGINVEGNVVPKYSDGYNSKFAPSPEGVAVAAGTTRHCGNWHVAEAADTCVTICVGQKIPAQLFLKVNPSLGTDHGACSEHLEAGKAYCVGPNYDWEDPWSPIDPDPEPTTTTTTSTTTSTSTLPTHTPSFHVRACYHNDCTGDVHNNLDIDGDTCINTDCKVASLDVAATGLCPDGQVQISYWEKPNCSGEWYGYGYASRGQCRGLWTDGWEFQSLHLRCTAPITDCVNQGSCTYDPEPAQGHC